MPCCVLTLLYSHLLTIFLLSTQITNLCREQLQFTVVSEKNHPLLGLPRIILNFDNDDKVCKLSLMNCSNRKDNGSHDLVDDPRDPHSAYKLVHHICTYELPTFHRGPIFLREAPLKVRARRPQELQSLRAWYETKVLDNGEEVCWGKMGKNYPNDRVKALAEHCGFKPTVAGGKFTYRTARRTGLTKMASANVAAGEQLGSGRHCKLETSAIYQDRNVFTNAQRHKALWKKHNNDDDEDEEVKKENIAKKSRSKKKDKKRRKKKKKRRSKKSKLLMPTMPMSIPQMQFPQTPMMSNMMMHHHQFPQTPMMMPFMNMMTMHQESSDSSSSSSDDSE